jgi:hypothetical protein
MLLVGLKSSQSAEEVTAINSGGNTGGSSSSTAELSDAQYIAKVIKDNDIQSKVLIVKQD